MGILPPGYTVECSCSQELGCAGGYTSLTDAWHDMYVIVLDLVALSIGASTLHRGQSQRGHKHEEPGPLV